jgi:hypothetical protein
MRDKVISDEEIKQALLDLGFTDVVDEGRLRLVELLVKANNCSYNSHTEEAFLQRFGIVNKNRKINKKGSEFLSQMLYASCNNQSVFARSSVLYRQA